MDLDGVLIPGGGEVLFEELSVQAVGRIMREVRALIADSTTRRQEVDNAAEVTYLFRMYKMLEMVKDINSGSKILPLWAEGRAMEALMILESDSIDNFEISPDNDYNQIEILRSEYNGQETSDFSQFLRQNFNRKMSPTFDDKLKGISMKSFLGDQKLKENYKVVAYGKPMFKGEFEKDVNVKELFLYI